jgi:hypothetical protein
MVWLEDPLTADAPHRGIVEEEDEAMARELVPQYAITPQVQWTAAAVKQATVVRESTFLPYRIQPPPSVAAGAIFSAAFRRGATPASP